LVVALTDIPLYLLLGGGSSVFYDGIKREGLEGITLALVELALELDPMRKPFN